MKHRALTLILALCMIFVMMPGQADAVRFWALPEVVATPMTQGVHPQPLAKTYTITMTFSGSGKAELYNATAVAGESIYFLADPAPGYKVSFDKCGYYSESGQQSGVRLIYIGANLYELVMPAGDVVLDLEFVKITTVSHNVKLTIGAGGMASVDQNTAKKGESLFVEVITGPGYSAPSVRTVSGGKEDQGHYLGTVDGARLYEVLMPDADVEILVNFERNGPYTVDSLVETAGGSLVLSHKSAYELETVTVTAKPDRGYRVASVTARHAQLHQEKENVWTFSMPRFSEQIRISFEPIAYPVRASLEVAVGGTVALSADSATIGQIVTLTCVPDPGYRVARITGAKVTDEGNNTYTFVMGDAAVELKVLFQRQENPFLDVNETQFFYDPVQWAVEEGITSGISAEAFGPFQDCNRAQVVTFLWRAAGSPEPVAARNPFTDVPEGGFYHKAVLWAVENGITNGLTETTFGPTAVCNRAQVVTFLHRANGSPAAVQEENPFTDVQSGSWYEAPVLWALENGITTGSDANHFNPSGQCLRAQVVTFLYRAAQLSSK